jgi:L-cystine transport system ATP-binding protein
MIQLKNIHKSFGKHEVLKGIDLSVQQGEVVVILGPSGSGKTTLLRCINFLERPNEGEVAIDGFNVNCRHCCKEEILTLRKKTGMVFQHYNLFKNKTVLENVMEGLVVAQKIPREIAQQQSIHILEKIGLNEKLKAYPSEISGGQQQRVGIARALALNPKVILFDEPTSALDPELVGEVLQAIKRVAREGITMIVVTHEIDFALDIATKVVFMDGGLIVEQGMPDEVISHPKEERTKQFLRRLLPETSFSI